MINAMNTKLRWYRTVKRDVANPIKFSQQQEDENVNTDLLLVFSCKK